jgi:hypothetical protein
LIAKLENCLIATAEQPCLHVVAVVWGEDYSRLFCNLALRSQLAPGNLPALVSKLDLHYFLYTTQEDALLISEHPAWKELQRIAVTHIELLPKSPTADKFDRVSASHITASNRAARSGAYISFLVPDSLYADGSLGNLFTYIEKGDVRAVMTLGMRTNRQATLDWIEARFPEEATVLNLPPREAVALAISNLHAVECGMFWGEKEHSSHLSHTYFHLDDQSFLAFCWHLHPILVKPHRADLPIHMGTIDGGSYLDAVIEEPERIVVIQDSDNFFSLEVSSTNHFVSAHASGPLTIRALARWARYHGNGVYRRLFQLPIWVHAGPSGASDLRRKDQLGSLVQSTVVGPVLYLSRFAFFFSRLALAVTWLRGHYIKLLLGRLRQVRLTLLQLSPALRRRARRVVRWGLVRLFQRFPLARRIALQAGALAHAVTPRDAVATFYELRSLEERQKQLALELLQHGAVSEATTLTRQLLTAADHGRAASIERDLFSFAMGKLNTGELVAAQSVFHLAAEAHRTPENAFYSMLVGTLLGLKAKAEELGANYDEEREPGERFVFSAVVWGDDYIDNFMRYTMRSLLAPANLPALADGQVYFSIVTTEAGGKRIRSASSYGLLEQHATVVFFTFPEELTRSFHYSRPTVDFYRLYGALDHTSIHFARSLHAHIFFIVVDGVLSGNTISGLREALNDGYDICVNASIVSDRETLLPVLDEQFGFDSVIDLPARELANIGFAHRHHYITQRLVVPENNDFDKYPRELYFPTSEGLVVHALYQHPLVISANAICSDIVFDYYVVDANLIASILDNPSKFKRLKVITDSSEAYVANFAPAGRKFDSTGKPLNINDFVFVHHHSQPIHHYIWKHRQLIRLDTHLRSQVDPQKTADEFLAALNKELGRIGR